MVLNKTLESPLDCKEIQPVHSEEEQPWESLEGMMPKLSLIFHTGFHFESHLFSLYVLFAELGFQPTLYPKD